MELLLKDCTFKHLQIINAVRSKTQPININERVKVQKMSIKRRVKIHTTIPIPA